MSSPYRLIALVTLTMIAVAIAEAMPRLRKAIWTRKWVCQFKFCLTQCHADTHHVSDKVNQRGQTSRAEECPDRCEDCKSGKNDSNDVAYNHGIRGNCDSPLGIPDLVRPVDIFQGNSRGKSLLDDLGRSKMEEGGAIRAFSGVHARISHSAVGRILALAKVHHMNSKEVR